MGFRVIDIQRVKKKSACIFFVVAFLSRHYRFMNCFEILNFVFSSIILNGVLTCKKITFLGLALSEL